MVTAKASHSQSAAFAVSARKNKVAAEGTATAIDKTKSGGSAPRPLSGDVRAMLGCPGMSGDVGGCPGMSGDVRGCRGMSGDVRGCPGMSGDVQAMSGDVRGCPGDVRAMLVGCPGMSGRCPGDACGMSGNVTQGCPGCQDRYVASFTERCRHPSRCTCSTPR